MVGAEEMGAECTSIISQWRGSSLSTRMMGNFFKKGTGPWVPCLGTLIGSVRHSWSDSGTGGVETLRHIATIQ